MLRLPYICTSVLFQYSPGNQGGLFSTNDENDLHSEDISSVLFWCRHIAARLSILIVSLMIELRTSHYHLSELSMRDEIIFPSFGVP